MKTDFTRNLGYSTLDPGQFEKLHYATLDILDQVGVNVYSREALDLLSGAGARVCGNRAYIPEPLVKEALSSAPSSIHVRNRSGNRAMTLENGRSYYGTGSDTPNVFDFDARAQRKAVKQDVANAAVLCDALKNIDFVMSMGLVSDALEKSYLHQFEAMLLNTEKPIVCTAANLSDMEKIYEMACIAVGGEKEFQERKFVILYDEPSSPLQHTAEAVEKLLFCAEKGIPVIYVPAVMLGATGPVTPAGSIAQATAETLSGLVIHQLKSKGAPFIAGGGAPPMDMRTMVCSYGAPERDLTCTSLVAMAHYYDLPSFTTGGASDAQAFDQQAGLEMGFNLLISGLAGGNLIHNVGYLGIGMTASLEAIAMCNDGIGMVRRLMRGVEVNDGAIALDVVEDVGPGGNFIAEEHTFENFKDVLFVPELLNRMDYENWKRAGALPFGERANLRVKDILANHKVKELPVDAIAKIKAVLER